MSRGLDRFVTLPIWLQWIAQNQPLTPAIETIRGPLLGSPLGASPLWALGWCALMLVAAIVWAAAVFRTKAARR